MSEDSSSDVGERAIGELQVFLQKAQTLPTELVIEIAEEFRVSEMLAKSTPRRRKIYDVVADYFEHVAHERRKEERAGEEDTGIGGALRAIVESFDDDEKRNKDD